ncbi:MAG: TolC family protein [Spirochaetales bacterium]|nr:TolC family protein [Spirochaetales bacterium]
MKKLLSGLVLISAIVGTGWASPIVLTKEKCIELAIENNVDLQVAAIDLAAAEREKGSSWNNFLPEITATAGMDGDTALLDSDSDMDWALKAGIGVELPLTAGLAYTVKALNLDYENEQINYETDRLELINNVENNFNSLIATKAGIDIAKANLDLAERRYQQTLNLYNNGLETELSTLSAKVSAAKLKPTYLKALESYNSALRSFLLLIGLEPDAEVEIEGSLDFSKSDFDSEALIDKFLMNRMDIKSALMNIEILENSRKKTASNSLAPSLGLSTSWYAGVNDAFGDASFSDKLSDSLSLGLSLSIPLDDYIPGSSTNNTIKGIDDQIESAKMSLEDTIKDAKLEIINIVEQLKTLASTLEMSELNVELAKLTYDKSEESYEQGGTERLDVEDAQQDYISAKQECLESQYDYLSELIDLRYALGLESLDTIKNETDRSVSQ